MACNARQDERRAILYGHDETRFPAALPHPLGGNRARVLPRPHLGALRPALRPDAEASIPEGTA